MAVKFIEQTKYGLIGFWEITESTDLMMSDLQPDEQDLAGFRLFRNEPRKREWLAARLLLRQMTGKSSKIDYDPAGKPVLLNTPGNISITHTAERVAICYHQDLHPGIDIELFCRNTERAAKKFLSPEELNDCTIDGRLSNKDLLLRWCAKEAVFKMVPFKEIDFASQIACQAAPLINMEGELMAAFRAKGLELHIPLHYRLIDTILMVWGAISPGYQTSSFLQ
jgi:4'-phosphopantetheinyl transferase